MRHISDGLLRRVIDDPLILSAADRQHLETCAVCQATVAAMTADSQAVAGLLSGPVPPVDPGAAAAAMGVRAAGRPAPLPPIVRSVAARVEINPAPAVRTLAAVAIATVLVVGMVVSGAAANLLTIFEPKQVTAVPVTSTDLQSLQGLPDLSEYGTIRVTTQPVLQSVTDAQAAATASHLQIRQPSQLPASVTGPGAFAIVSQGNGSFTFSAAKAEAAAQRQGKALPAMPANIDGSTLYLTVGPAVVETFGFGGGQQLPSLVIAQARVPRVQSTGVSVRQLEDYLLSQPGISPTLAAQIRAIGDPSQTLPIPIPANLATSHPVTVQGVHGVAIGDSSGLGSAVIWVKDGVVYAVGGTLTEAEVLQVANSLH
ncbi:MAG TPA: hypothetical protein VET82_01340 [Candidatus Eisenbacteria bacterium]|nr:hypothetical protein [Candidatus Eisenbacteria bacterium]